MRARSSLRIIRRLCWLAVACLVAVPAAAQGPVWLKAPVLEKDSVHAKEPAGRFQPPSSQFGNLAKRLADQEQALSQTQAHIEQQQALIEQQAREIGQFRRSLESVNSTVFPRFNALPEGVVATGGLQPAGFRAAEMTQTDLTAGGIVEAGAHSCVAGAECEECTGRIYQLQNKLDSFFEKVDISGHVRVRHETDFERINRPTRNRGRLRARLGMTYQLNPEIKAGLRMTTGDRKIALEPDDRSGSVLSYQDTGDVFDKFAFNLDRIFITFSPEWMPGIWLTGGKFKHPFVINPIYAGPVGDLVWDEAANPEGIAGSYTWKDTMGLDELSVTLGETVVLELSNVDEASLFFIQLWAKKQLEGRPVKVEGGVAWYDWHNLNPDGNTTISTENNAGNSVTQVGVDSDGNPFFFFDSQFSIINPLVFVTYGDADDCSTCQPVQLVWEAFWNTEAFHKDRDFGYSLGVAYGPAVTRKKQWDWKIYYTWNEVEQESVFTPVAQDDFQRATNFRGHWIGLDIYPWEQTELRLWLLSDKPIIPIAGSRETEWRARADITVYF